MSGEMDEEESSRRRLLALLGAALLALVGAGTGARNLFGGGDDGEGTDGLDLSIDYSVTPDEPNATPTPTPTPTPGGGGSDANPTDTTDPPERSETTADDSAGENGETDGADDPDGADADSSSAESGVVITTGTASPGSDLVSASIPPVSISDVEPGDSGVVDLSLTLSGSPARLWVRGAATDFAEGGVVEAERSAGDTGEPGELQQYVTVRLWYDADGNGTVSGGDNVVYEGTLADLNELGGGDGWTPLTETCVPPGTHTARFRWELPADAPNRIQTDSASFSLGVAADASACE